MAMFRKTGMVVKDFAQNSWEWREMRIGAEIDRCCKEQHNVHRGVTEIHQNAV